MKNLSDLNKMLFKQLEKLENENENIDLEVKRTESMIKVSSQIINNAALILRAFEGKEKPLLFEEPTESIDDVLKEIEEKNKITYKISTENNTEANKIL